MYILYIVLTNKNQFNHFNISTISLERNVSDHAPICFELGDRPIKLPAQEHEVFSKANWNIYTNTLKTNLASINLNNKNTNEIDRALNEIETASKIAQNLAIPKSKFRYSERNLATPKFHRLQKVLAQIYILIIVSCNIF